MSEKNKIKTILPLTPMQEGILFHSLIDNHSSAYFEQMTFTMTGDLNVDALHGSLSYLIEQNDVLRTVFVYEKVKRPRQIVISNRETPFSYQDISMMTPEESEKYIRGFEEEDKRKGFNLNRGPLIRLSVLKTSENKHRIILSFHHIILDGWSLGIVLQELFQCYHRITGQQNIEGTPRRSFRDYIDWLEQRSKEEAREYWSQYLKGYEKATVIPSTKCSANESVYIKNELEYTLDEALYGNLKLFSQTAQVTINTLFQTIWGVVLQQYNNTNDVVFGTVVSGRHAEVGGMDNMIGLFINTIPVRIHADPAMSFMELVRSVQLDLVQSERYDWLSITDIQTHLNLPNHFINHIVAFENYQKDQDLANLFSGGEAYRFHIENLSVFEQTNYDLNLLVIPGVNLKIKIIFNESIFEANFIQSILKHMVNVMRQVVASNEIPINQIELVDNNEKQKLLSHCRTDYNYPFHHVVHTLFERQALKNPEKNAIVDKDSEITYRDLNEKANQLSESLRLNGLIQNEIVGLFADRSIDMIVGMLAILKAGGAYLPISVDTPFEQVKAIIADSQMKLMLTQSNYLQSLNIILIDIILIDDLSHQQHSTRNPENHASPHDLVYVIYTSGTTGKPKGVMIKHIGLLNMLYFHKKTFHTDEKMKMSQTASIGFDAMAFEVWPALVWGATLFIASNDIRLDPIRMEEWLNQSQISMTFQSTAIAEYLIDYDWPSETHLRVLLTAGDKLTKYPKKKLPFEFYNLYGPTEDTVWTTYAKIKSDSEPHLFPSIGKPIDNHQVFILDTHNKLQPTGIPGELCIGGIGLAREYLNQVEYTKEKFIPNPFQPNKTLYKTGDFARWLPDGNIEFLGRMDNQVKIRGYRVELGEIESVLLQVPGIQEVIVLTRSNQYEQKYICAYFLAETSLDIESIKKQLARRLPSYMIPVVIIQLDKFPLNQNGKIDRNALLELKEAAIQSKKKHSPDGDREIEIAKVWSDILGIQEFDRHDNFFDMGGHSLTAIQLYAQLSQKYQLTIQDIFDYKTIQELALHIKSKNDNAKGQIQFAREMAKKDAYSQAWKKEKQVDYEKKIWEYRSVHLTETIPYQHVLLCGSTGYFGIHILDQLLNETKATIHCLIRGKNYRDAVEKLRRKCLFYFNEDLVGNHANRIVVHRGDLSQSNLGLDKNGYLRQSNTIDCIINAAANVRHFGHDQDFYNINVKSVENLVQFALLNKKKDIHHISTLSVGVAEIQNQEAFFFTEFDVNTSINYPNPYIQTKLEAERIVLEARKKGIDTSIYRVGNLMFHSETGKFQENIHENAFYQSLRSYLRLGCFPDFTYQNIDFTFVDKASRAFVFLFNKLGLKNEIHHIVNPNFISISNLGYWMKNSGYAIKILPIETFFDFIDENSLKKEMKDDIQDLMIYSYALFHESKRLVIKNDKTDSFLKRMGFEWNALTQSHFDKMLAYCRNIFLEIH